MFGGQLKGVVPVREIVFRLFSFARKQRCVATYFPDSMNSMFLLSFILLFCATTNALDAEETTNTKSEEYVHPLLEPCEHEFNIEGLSLEHALVEIGSAIQDRLREEESAREALGKFLDHIEHGLFGRDLWDFDYFNEEGVRIVNRSDNRLKHSVGFIGAPSFEGIERESGDTVRLVYNAGGAGTSAIYSEYRFVRYNFVDKKFLGDHVYAEIYEGTHKDCLYELDYHLLDVLAHEYPMYARGAELIESFLSELPEDSWSFINLTLVEETPADHTLLVGATEDEHNANGSDSSEFHSTEASSWSLSGEPASAVRDRNGVAVIIGNRTYTHDRVPEVSYAHRDADAFRQYVLDVVGFDPDNVIDYRDADKATMEAVFGNERNHKGHIWRRLNPDADSDVVVFYSGHGVPGLNDGVSYLLPVNADPNTAEINGYPLDLLYRNLSKLSAARSVRVFLDACFSGDSGGGHLVRSASPVYVTSSLPDNREGMTVLTASSGGQVASWDEEMKHGLFTHHLLDALYGKGDKNKDGSVTALEAKEYLDKEMTGAARRLFGRTQHADLRGEAATVLAALVSSEGFPQRPILNDIGHRSEEGKRDRIDGHSSANLDVPPTWKRDEDSGANTTAQVMDLLKGITLADWALLAERRLASGDYSRLVAEAKQLTLAYGRDLRVLSVAERAVSGLARDAATIMEADPPTGLSEILSIIRLAGEWPSLIRVKARAHELMLSFEWAEEANVQWLRGTAPNHPDRSEVLAALLRVRTLWRAAKDESALDLSGEQQELIVHGLIAQGVEAGLMSYVSIQGFFSLRANRDRAVLRAWQEENGWEPTGYLTFEQCYVLIEVGHGKREEQEMSGREFRDCPVCPEMVVVPAGSFMMGSPSSEQGRSHYEGPRHRVTIDEPFAVSKHEVTREEFARFVKDSDRAFGSSCWVWADEEGQWKWKDSSGLGWQNPGYTQTFRHPVACVNWRDAKAYVRWLSRKTGERYRYRLLSEAEWEYAVRAGTTGPFYFGSTITTSQANYNGHGTYGSGRKGVYRNKTMPVGLFPESAFGVHNMHGNVAEWVEDCWHSSYAGAPTEGGAWVAGGDCELRVVRGGSWNRGPWDARSAYRVGFLSEDRVNDVGFRVSRTLTP